MKTSYIIFAIMIMLIGVSGLSAAYSTLFNTDFNVSAPPAGWSIAGTVGTGHTTPGTAKTNADLFKNDGGNNYLRLTENAGYNRAWAYYTEGKFNVMAKWKITAEVRIGKTHNGTEITDGADGLCFVFADAATVETSGSFDASKVTGGYGQYEGAPRGSDPNVPFTGSMGYHAGFRGFSLEFDHYNNTGELFREYIHWVDLNDWQHSGLGADLSGDTGFYYNDGWERIQVEAYAGLLTFSYNWNGSTYNSSFSMNTLNPPNANCDDLYSFDAYFGVSASTGGQTAFHEIRLFQVEKDVETLPVELSSFTAIVTPQSFVRLDWITQSETGVLGYYLYRNTIENANSAEMVSPLISATNTSQEVSYSYTDREIPGDATYYYWLQNQDINGMSDMHGPVMATVHSNTNDTPVIPLVTSLGRPYPNPFNPDVTIVYGLAKAEHIQILIYNNKGQVVRSLLDAAKNPGTARIVWNGTADNGKALPTGIYYIKMTAGKYHSTQKIVLMK